MEIRETSTSFSSGARGSVRRAAPNCPFRLGRSALGRRRGSAASAAPPSYRLDASPWHLGRPRPTSYRYLDASPWHLGWPRPARVPMAATPAHPGHLRPAPSGLQYGHGIAGGAQRALAGIIPKHRCWAAMKSTLTESGDHFPSG